MNQWPTVTPVAGDPLLSEVRAYRTMALGMESIVWATSAGKARHCTVISANDAGWKVTYADVAVHRAPEFDDFLSAEAGRCYDPDQIPACEVRSP